mmetsp:Transcript_41580/g.50434  ORF Transcript_41580/g.50434 Transcript_41580/m.50434 type:complete len:206 (-) Transcript_41580:88-705(-)
MLVETLNRPHTLHSILRCKSQERQHCQPGVLDLLLHEALLGSGILRKTKRIERVGAQETSLPSLVVPVNTERLQEAHHYNLHPNEGRGVKSIVQCTSLVPLGESKLLSSNNSQGGHHSPATVHKFSLSVPGKGLLVSAETKGIEAVVAGHGAIEVVGRDSARVPLISHDSRDAHAPLKGGLGGDAFRERGPHVLSGTERSGGTDH